MIQSLINFIKAQDAKFIFLALMLIVLPSLEVPKNVFALAFVVAWWVIARRDKNWGGQWQIIDTIFLLWILADIVMGINAVVAHSQPANGSKDIIKFVLVGWAVSRSGFTPRQIISLCVMAIVATVIPLTYTYLNCSGGTCIELNSVGHVNHTAIYLLIVYVLSLSLLVFNFSKIGNALRATLIISSTVLFYVVIDTHSRAASGLLVIVTLLAMPFAIYHYRNRYALLISVLLVALASVVFAYNPPQVISKFVNGTNLVGDSPRHKIRNFAHYVFKIDPILGVGMGNFSKFKHEDIKALVIQDKGVYDKTQFMPFAHPHNLYYTYLTGGGVVLFAVLLWFWLQVVQIIYRVNKNSSEKWIVFSSVSVVMVVLGIGWVNTTLAHEHALITMFVLGLLIAKDRETPCEK